MANPNSPSSARARKSERDNKTTRFTETEGSLPQPAQEVTTSTDQPSWSSGSVGLQQPQDAGRSTAGGNGVGQKLRDQVNARLSSQKDRALDGVGGVTEALRQSTQSLRDRQHDTIAQYVEQVIGQIDRATQNLRQKDISQLLTDAQRLARRQPAGFVGSAFAIGLLGARFLKSSPAGEQRGASNDGSPRGQISVSRAQE